MNNLPINTSGLSIDQKAALVLRLRREATRLSAMQKWPTGHDMSIALDHRFKRTPMLEMIGQAVQDTVDQERGRLIVSSPPQIGKSMTVAVWGAVRALLGDPSLRIVVASYSEALAGSHVATARGVIARNGFTAVDTMTGAPLPDRLGIGVSQRAGSTGWVLEGQQGGMYGVGVGGSLSGKPADLMIVDDPLKGMSEADSPAYKRRLFDWWRSVALARLSPTASVILVQTRWTEDDLAGQMLEDKTEEWRYLNFPAIAEDGIPDALGREPGTPLVTSRGHTMETWERTRSAVGERVWTALYQGIPTPVAGGLFLREWLDRFREPTPPPLETRIVAVDPAETGRRDEAGVVAMGATPTGKVVVTDDRSGKMTSDEWARTAVVLALQTGASELSFEAYTAETTYRRVIEMAWRDVELELRQAKAAGLEVPGLEGLEPSGLEEPPFIIRGWRGRGDKVARAAGARQGASTGRLVLAGAFPALERQMVTWQQGKASPDRVDALVQGFNRLQEMRGYETHIVSPVRATGRTTGLGARLSRRL